MGTIGLAGVIMIDFTSFLFAVSVLFFVRIPQAEATTEGKAGSGSLLQETAFGWKYIMARPGLAALMLLFALSPSCSSRRKLAEYQRSSLGELLQAQQAAQAAIDGLPDPVLVLDVAGEVLNLNQAAEAVLRLPHGGGATWWPGSTRRCARWWTASGPTSWRPRRLAPKGFEEAVPARPGRRRALAPAARHAALLRGGRDHRRHHRAAGRLAPDALRRAEERPGRHGGARVPHPAHLAPHGHPPLRRGGGRARSARSRPTSCSPRGRTASGCRRSSTTCSTSRASRAGGSSCCATRCRRARCSTRRWPRRATPRAAAGLRLVDPRLRGRRGGGRPGADRAGPLQPGRQRHPPHAGRGRGGARGVARRSASASRCATPARESRASTRSGSSRSSSGCRDARRVASGSGSISPARSSRPTAARSGVESEPGHGSRFWFTLRSRPAAEAAEHPSPPQLLALPPQRRGVDAEDAGRLVEGGRAGQHAQEVLRSISSSVKSPPSDGTAGRFARIRSGSASRSSTGPGERMTARSMALRSSRTLPGQG